ncbi:hypothetical protein Unana1_08333 [Umbelopsis nana]
MKHNNIASVEGENMILCDTDISASTEFNMPEVETTMEEQLITVTVTVTVTSALNDLNTLYTMLYLIKTNKQPATQQDFETFVEEIKLYGVCNPAIPDELELLWNIVSEWHIIADQYDVFGFNIHGPKKVLQTTKNVFGDEDIRKEWVSDHGKDPCGADWLCLAGYTEYDYLFMNFNRQSELFGTTRHMVNNCNEEKELTKPPLANFVEYIKTHIESFE